MRPYFVVGCVARVACLPFLLQWFHPDERQWLEFANYHAHGRLHPFLESTLALRNQTFPWLASIAVRLLDAIGLSSPRWILMVIHGAIGALNWVALAAAVELLRRKYPGQDRRVDRLGWFLALFWAFPFLYSRGLLEAISLPFALGAWVAYESGRVAASGACAGAAAFLRYPSALWAAGLAALAARDRAPPRSWLRALAAMAGAIALGGLADWLAYGSWLRSAGEYWAFNRPGGPVAQMFGHDSLAVYWRWFEFVFTPWGAPVFLLAAAYSLWHAPRIALFCAPYIIGHLWTPHREPRFMLSLTPFLALAIGEAALRGGWDRWLRPLAGYRAFRALVGLHVALNFAWYPLQAWGQLQSAQGVLVRSYARIAAQAPRLLALGDPPVDALIPPGTRWTGPECQWHRPASETEEASSRTWVLMTGSEPPPAAVCLPEGAVGVPAIRSEALRRLLRVRTGSLWECSRAVEAALCPFGIRANPPDEPWTGRLGVPRQ